MNSRVWVFMWWLMVAGGIVQAATIQGTVYDLELRPMEDVLVEVDSTPVQKMLVQAGKYSFQLPQGRYSLVVKGGKGLSEVVAREVADVQGEGVFTIDIIVFPEVGNGNEELGVAPGQVLEGLLEEKQKGSLWGLLVLIGLIAAGGVLFLVAQRGKKKTERQQSAEKGMGDEASLDQIIEVLKTDGGRMTQKDLRKRLPFSEAKLSLMLTELEAKGRIEKIKKGRGNIIVIKQ